MNDIVMNKVQSIHRCIERAREEFKNAGMDFDEDYSRQDAAILNIIRACEQSIDLANHIIRTYKFGIPNSSSDSFELLVRKVVISSSVGKSLKNMVSFRNRMVHEYQRLDIALVKKVIETELDNLVIFTEKIMEFVK